jgi:nucleotide-binding universal stress UspA family protein
MARKYESRVFVANIWAPVPYTLFTPENASTLDQTQEDEARGQASALLTTRELSDLPASVIVAPGSPAVELGRMVRKTLIRSSWPLTCRTGFKHLVMGSVAEELFRSLPCPVLTVGPNVSTRPMERTEIKQVLFPTDFSDESQDGIPTPERASGADAAGSGPGRAGCGAESLQSHS